MADIKKIEVSGTEYDVKDASALHNIGNGTGSLVVEGSTAPSSAVNYTTVMGMGAVANGIYSTAIGYNAGSRAPNVTYSTAIGYNTKSNYYGTAVGYLATVNSSYGTAIGYNTTVASGVALGYSANASGTSSIAIGYSARTQGNYSIAIGNSSGSSNSSASNSVFIGYNTGSYAGSNTFVGYNIHSTVNYASGNTCVGYQAGPVSESQSSFSGNVCIGASAKVSSGVYNAVQIGSGTNANYGTVQFFSYPFLDNTGKIYSDRMPAVVLQGTSTMPDPLNLPIGSTIYYSGATTSEYTQNTMYSVEADYTQEQPCFLASIQTTYSSLFSSITIDNTSDKFLNYFQNTWNCHFGRALDYNTYYNNVYTYLYYDNQTTNKFWIYGLSGGYGDIEEENYHYNTSDKRYFTQSELESLLGITIADWNPSVLTSTSEYNWIGVVCMSSKMWLYPRGDGATAGHGGSSAQGYKVDYDLMKTATAAYQSGNIWRWEWDSTNSVWKVMVNGTGSGGSGGTLIESVTTAVLKSKYGFKDGNNWNIEGNEANINYIYATIGLSYKPVWRPAEKTIDTMLRSLTGYDSTVASQSLKNVNGVPQWVTD